MYIVIHFESAMYWYNTQKENLFQISPRDIHNWILIISYCFVIQALAQNYFQTSPELHINGGRLSKKPHSPYASPLNTRPTSRSLHKKSKDFQSSRPFTAQPKSSLLDPAQILANQNKNFRTNAAGQHRNSDNRKPLKAPVLPDLQMTPLTVPLLPHVGLRIPSYHKKRSNSPLR